MKIFTGVVIDEDSKQAYTDNTSYDIIGFALLNLDDLTISYVTKDCVSDKLKQDSSIVYYPPKEFNRYKVHCT